MSEYRHEPLGETYRPMIRLLRPYREAYETQTRYELCQQHLLICWDYIALSYMWSYRSASSTSKPSIFIDREGLPDAANLQIGQNLSDFLHAYSTHPWGFSRRPHFLLWTDQICIDQSNLVERNAQVSVMNQIYKRATRVLVWLGQEPEMVEAARRLQGKSRDDHAFARLLRHPYFSRIWIVQEVSLTTNVYIVCGEIELEWRVIFQSGKYWQNGDFWSPSLCRSLECSSYGTPSDAKLLDSSLTIPRAAFALISRSGRFNTLEDIINKFCRNGCQDPRDKVYALLGLTSERWRMRIDYRKTVVDVYIDTVKALFEELFDRLDPECHFGWRHTLRGSGARDYRLTALILAEAMGLPAHQVNGLPPFLERLLDKYLDTPLRNIEFPYISRIPLSTGTDQEGASWLRCFMPWSTSSTPKNTATRRNPFLRDVIPAVGLQVAPPSTENTMVHGLDSGLVHDRWWFEYEGEIHYFDCPEKEVANEA